MATAREILNRIGSVNDTMKITNAMYMISSAKVKKAKNSLDRTRPYFDGLQRTMQRLLRHIPDIRHRYFGNVDENSDRKYTKGYIVISADKGLAGPYVHNIVNLTIENLPKPEENAEYMLFVLGEMGRDQFLKNGYFVDSHFKYAVQDPNFSRTRWIISQMEELYNNSKLDELYVVYSRMKGLGTEAVIERLLPLKKADFGPVNIKVPIDVLVEDVDLFPDPSTVIERIVPPYLSGYLYGALVESFCSEQNSRMMAMQAATDSAKDIVKYLNKEYNRVRQGSITQEITEVIAGARAQKARKKNAKKLGDQL